MSFDDAKDFFGGLKKKNYKKELDTISLTIALNEHGKGIFHALMESSLTENEKLCIVVMEELYKRGVAYHTPSSEPSIRFPVHIAIDKDTGEILRWYLDRDDIFDTTFKGYPLVHYAAYQNAFKCMQVIHTMNPGQLQMRLTVDDGLELAPIHIHLIMLHQHARDSDIDLIEVAELKTYLKEKVAVVPGFQISEKEKRMVDFFIEKSHQDTYDFFRYGSILHVLIELNYFEGISEVLRKSSDSGLLQDILIKTNAEEESPLFCALKKPMEHYKAARILLEYGSDANECISRDGEQVDNDTSLTSPIRYLMKSEGTNEENMHDVIQIILTKTSNFQIFHDSLKVLLDEYPSSLEIFEIVINEATKRYRGSQMTDLFLNHQSPMHFLVRSSKLTDITEHLVFLLESGADPMVTRNSDKYPDGGELPVHIAASLQYTYQYQKTDEPTLVYSDITHGDYAKGRLKQYLDSFQKIGLHKVLRRKSREYKVDFVKNHLSPGVYLANHNFVHGLMRLFDYFPKDSQESIIHFKMENTENTKFDYHIYQRTALGWATQNDQPFILNLLVRAYYTIYRPDLGSDLNQSGIDDGQRSGATKKSSDINGIDYFQKLPPTTFKTQAIRAYIQLANPRNSWKDHLPKALIMVTFLCHFLFALDIYLDVKLTQAFQQHSTQLDNVNSSNLEFVRLLQLVNLTAAEMKNMDQNQVILAAEEHLDDLKNASVTEAEIFYLQKSETYWTAMVLSCLLLVPSSINYLMVSWFLFDIPKDIKEYWMSAEDSNYANHLWMVFLGLIKPILFPIIQFLRYIRSQSNPNHYGMTQLFKECDDLWRLVRRAETGIESVGQIMLQIWVFSSYLLLFQMWSWNDLIKHLWLGGGYLITFTFLETTFVEKVMGRFVFAILSTSAQIAMLKVKKPTENVLSLLIFWAATLSQLIARAMTIRLLFLTKLSGASHVLCLLLHILMEIIIKIAFEYPSLESYNHLKKGEKVWQHIKNSLKVILCSICSSLVYLDIDKAEESLKNENMKKTFLPLTFHMTLCFIEQLILTLVPSERIGKSWPFVLLPFILLAVASGLYILYYKKMHPGHLLHSNGPRCYCSGCNNDKEDFCNSSLQGLVCLKIRTICERSRPPFQEEMIPLQENQRPALNGNHDNERNPNNIVVDEPDLSNPPNGHALMLNGSTKCI